MNRTQLSDKSTIGMTDEQFDRAAKNIASYIEERSEKLSAELGFTWFPTEDAPNTHPALVEAWDRSTTTGCDLPISSLNSDDVIFPSPIDNIRLRFYHDCSHMQNGIDFTPDNEVELAQIHLREAADHMSRTSDEFRVFQADTLGQALMMQKARRFAHDQKAFAKDFIRHGIDEAIARDIERAKAAGGSR